MNDYVNKTYNEISDFLIKDNKNMEIACILYDEKTKATYTIATDGNEKCYSFDPYTKNEPNGYIEVPDWDFNFDYYVFDLLEKGCKIGYMTDEMHYGIWNAINELYPNDIEFTDGVLKYIDYCKNHTINKSYLDDKMNLEVKDIMPLFDEKQIRVLYVEPDKLPVVKLIDNDLETKQKLVGGYIECAYILHDEDVVLICNEEGKLNGMKLNRDIGYDIIAGPFIIAADDKDSGEFKSLSDDQIKKYKERFNQKSIDNTNKKINEILMQKRKNMVR